jgi:hypothetical protein
MKRREFLHKGVALGATALLPNIGLPANSEVPTASAAPMSSTESFRRKQEILRRRLEVVMRELERREQLCENNH